MPLTTNEIAEKLGTDRETAYKLVSFMKDMKLINVVGNRPNPKGKGKGSDEFNIPTDCGAKLAALIAKLL